MAWMLAATLVMAACSDSLDESSGNGNSNEYVGTKGYVRVAINTPTTSGNITRADDNYDADSNPNPDIKFEDGTANEYKITDGVIVFFKASSGETDPDTKATFVSAYRLAGITTQDDPLSQVTEKVVTVTEAPMVDNTKEKLYALVILNVPSTVSVGADDHSLTLNGTALDNTATLAKFTSALTSQDLDTYIGENKDDFTMCNAPLSTVAGTGSMNNAAAKTLVSVEVYPTENEALSHDAARIYVERVVAKVTLTGFTDGAPNSDSYKKNVTAPAGSVYDGDVVQLDGWILNVTNKSTALVRNVSGFSATGWLDNTTVTTNKIERFAGKSVIPVSDNTNYYRIYWAEDGNYDGTIDVDTEFDTYYTDQATGSSNPETMPWNKHTADNTSDNTKDYALYCLENTMEEDLQAKNQTTSVLLKTTYLSKFGTQLTATAQDFFICGANPIKYPKANDIPAVGGGTVQDIISFVVTEANKVLGQNIDVTELGVKSGAVAGIYDASAELTNLFAYTGTAYSGKEDEIWSAIHNQVGTIRYYAQGANYYYAARIRHFNDDETDWNNGETYGIQHLGRYGVVRNNWYEVNINKITGPGEPVIVKPDDGANDEAEGYIRAEINVLSWAKRSQGVEL